MRRLLAFDLDGTLLGPDHRLSPEVHMSVGKLSRDFWITLATGRSRYSAWPFVRSLGVAVPVILYNGAVIHDFLGVRTLRVKRLPLQEAREAISIAGGFPVDIEVYRDIHDPTLYVDRITPRIAHFMEKEKLPAREVGDLLNFLDFPPLKLLILGDPVILHGLETALRECLPRVQVVRSEAEYLEVLPPGSSKGEALGWLCGYLRIPPRDVVAVGDQLNDLEMIRYAGIGVAMAHGPEGLRRAADLVISSVEELPRILPR